MNILFLSEANFYGKVRRDFPNMRTDMAWQCALESDHVPLQALYNNETVAIRKAHQQGMILTGRYDWAIVIIPKKNPEFAIESLPKIRAKADKVAVMQEGAFWYYQDYPVKTQMRYLQFLCEVELIFCHNEKDKNYYQGIVKDHVPVEVLPTLIIEDSVKDLPDVDRNGTMIGGNFVSWYGGMDSMIVAAEYEEEIYAPSMGRKQEGEDSLDIHHYQYMNWVEWIKTLNKHKYAVHLMRTHAAGTFALNCAMLGIPCIGYEGLDTQQNCFPTLTVPDGHLHDACKMAYELKSDEDYYKYISDMAKDVYSKLYSEHKFLEKINEIL